MITNRTLFANHGHKILWLEWNLFWLVLGFNDWACDLEHLFFLE